MMDPNLDLDLDPSFEPQQRARSNTWPLPRPDNFVDIKEEDEDVVVDLEHLGPGGHLASCGPGSAGLSDPLGLSGSSGLAGCVGSGTNGSNSAAAAAAAAAKKNSSRRNAWGNMSYADLITQAIQNSPDKRLTLSQIYDWMVQNVPYFKDKGDSNSSAGWKNSIRHNLSLHNRFMRVQNEGTGKSSWWMINPDAKPGKSARRRATSMETSKYEKKRGRVKKKVEALRAGLTTTPSPSSSISEGLDMFPESPQLHPVLGGFQLSPGDFRPRASSNASSVGSRLSPIPAMGLESDLLEPWSPEYAAPTLYRHAHPHHASSSSSLEPRFNADQLVDNLSESMKLGLSENGFRVGGGPGSNDGDSLLGSNGFSFPPSLPQQQQQQQQHSHPSQQQHAPAGFPYPPPPSYVNESKRSPQRLLSSALSDLPPPPYMPSLQALSPSQQANTLHLSPEGMGASPSNGYRPSLASFDATTATLLRAALGQNTNGTGNNGSNQQSLKEEAMVTPSQMMSQLMGALNNNGPMPQDLDLSLDTLQGGFDCNVDEVIKHELSMDGSLDFNFPHMGVSSSASQQPTTLTSCSSSPSVNSTPVTSSSSPYGLPPAFMSSNSLDEMLGVVSNSNAMPPPLCPITTSMSTGRSWVR